MLNMEQLAAMAAEAGFTHSAPLDVATLELKEEVRAMCNANACRVYGKNWSCPPACGELPELRQRVSGYSRGILVQTVGEVEDSMDFEGMMEAGARHNQVVNRVRDAMKAEPLRKVLHLGAGGCRMCEVCAKKTGEPCRHPDLAMSSLETYGINVSELAKAAGMKYINGQNTVTYFGAALFDL